MSWLSICQWSGLPPETNEKLCGLWLVNLQTGAIIVSALLAFFLIQFTRWLSFRRATLDVILHEQSHIELVKARQRFNSLKRSSGLIDLAKHEARVAQQEKQARFSMPTSSSAGSPPMHVATEPLATGQSPAEPHHGTHTVTTTAVVNARGVAMIQREESSDSDEDARSVRMILNRYELLAIGVFSRTLDEQMLHRWCRTMLLADWQVVEPYVHELRRVWSARSYYCEFERLAGRWERIPSNAWWFRFYKLPQIVFFR